VEELAVRMISSTYKRRYAEEDPLENTRSEVSDLEAQNPSLNR
jgi:hypothetical protein